MADIPMEWLKHINLELAPCKSLVKDPDHEAFLISILPIKGSSDVFTGEKRTVLVMFGHAKKERLMFTGWANIRTLDGTAIAKSNSALVGGKFEIKLVKLFSKKGKFYKKRAAKCFEDNFEYDDVSNFEEAVTLAKLFNNVVPFNPNRVFAFTRYPIGFIDSRCCIHYNISQSFDVILDGSGIPGNTKSYLEPIMKRAENKKRPSEAPKSSPKRQASKKTVNDLKQKNKDEIEAIISNQAGTMANFESAADKLTTVEQILDKLTTVEQVPTDVPPIVDVVSIPEVKTSENVPLPEPVTTPKCASPFEPVTTNETVSSFYTPIARGIVKANGHAEIARAFPEIHAIVEQLFETKFHYKELIEILCQTVEPSSEWRGLFVWLYVDHLIEHKWSTNLSRDAALMKLVMDKVESKGLLDMNTDILLSLVAQGRRIWTRDGKAIVFNDYNSEIPPHVPAEVEAFIFFTMCHLNGLEANAPVQAYVKTESLSEYLRRIA